MRKNDKLPKGIRVKANGHYEWRFQADGVSYSGTASSVTAAERAMRDKRYEVEHGIVVKDTRITVDEWFEEWITTYKKNCRPTTLITYRTAYRLQISPVIGKRKMKDVKLEHVQKLLNEIADKYSAATTVHAKVVLGGMFDVALKSKIIAVNPMNYIGRLARKKSEKRMAVSADTQRAFLDYAAGSCYYKFYRLATLTGMRINEICGLLVEDVDVDNDVIHVCRSLTYIPREGFVLNDPKTKSGKRDIPIIPETKEILVQAIIEKDELKIKQKDLWNPLVGMENLIFTDKFGAPIYATNVDKDMRDIIKRMREDNYELPPRFSFHSLRHCFATRCLEGGMPMKSIQAVLGHSTLGTTMDVYADVLSSTIAVDMLKIASKL